MNKDKKTTTNWDRCCLCQVPIEEKLVQPSLKTAHLDSGYETLAENIPKLHEVHILPIPLKPCRLDDGSGIEDTLIKTKAKYHNLCKQIKQD